jgi:hypothetical protein
VDGGSNGGGWVNLVCTGSLFFMYLSPARCHDSSSRQT